MNILNENSKEGKVFQSNLDDLLTEQEERMKSLEAKEHIGELILTIFHLSRAVSFFSGIMSEALAKGKAKLKDNNGTVIKEIDKHIEQVKELRERISRGAIN